MTAHLCLPDTLDTYPKDFCNPNRSSQTKAERKGVTWKENQSRNLNLEDWTLQHTPSEIRNAPKEAQPLSKFSPCSLPGHTGGLWLHRERSPILWVPDEQLCSYALPRPGGLHLRPQQEPWRQYPPATSGAQAVWSSCTQRNWNAGLRNYHLVAVEHFNGNAQSV